MNGRMYLAGYYNGARLRGSKEAREKNRQRMHEPDPHLIALGARNYALGFEHGILGQRQQVAGPLERWPS